MEAAELRILEASQRDFPLVPRPFAALGERLGVGEETVLAAFARAASEGVLSRLGAVFRPGAVGAGLLCALALPENELEAVAARVSAEPGVNHNYEREHRYNLWFVVTGQDEAALERTLAAIERIAGRRALRLPLVEEYYVDLGFALDGSTRPRAPRALPVERTVLSAPERALLGAVEEGLALVPRPFSEIGRRAGLEEVEVLARLRDWIARGLVRRFGAVLRHRPLGFSANAMALWQVPEARVREAGLRLAAHPAVTLCYRREPDLPVWPYTLYCMVHGRERQAVRRALEEASLAAGLAAWPRAVLFSRRCFVQRGARYAYG